MTSSLIPKILFLAVCSFSVASASVWLGQVNYLWCGDTDGLCYITLNGEYTSGSGTNVHPCPDQRISIDTKTPDGISCFNLAFAARLSGVAITVAGLDICDAGYNHGEVISYIRM